MRLILLLAAPFIAPLVAGTAFAQPAEVRVAFDASRITASRAAGLADRASGRPATADDPVRIASISKLVVALGVMRMVEAGQLDLDRDVSEVLGWPVRNPAFPKAPVTLRQLLSHTSGLIDPEEYRVPLGERLADRIAQPGLWDARQRPGESFRYANIGFPVIASVMEKASGERFDRLMHRLVLAPLKLDACFNWSTCADARIARAVVLYRADGSVALDDLGGKRPDCPVIAKAGCDLAGYRPGENGALFSPQGGLRASMRDLAVIGQMLLKNDGSFLKRESIAQIERVAWRYDGSNGDTSNGFYCQYGLGMTMLPTAHDICADDLFGDGRTRIGHAGDAYGLRSGLWIDRVKGTGVAFFATATPPDSKGFTAFTVEEERLAREKD
ncbi:class A beta-lactamase-related serine hydrolase [Sphingomonas koreensis]|uniref:serine hydrolase domain-containing protein n=1 Tax=Sphingomonas koreensis TaxID=93064 RepID=UPI0008363D08|nr:serine hydrolase domain-containing protein [Sphingomonas koreensis]PJI88836.1 CubicO group peptidase (beta-lactamase class C family) [Sphingomonas koreensis]RSU63559.1 class A beta-lactamase-related serine hydrolase [Sphingomonas koreensis]RSU64290.1 class A beta-lactamase-related serine hydrolase [Sphingomonas koreensis]